MAKIREITNFVKPSKRKRPGIHAKSKTSKIKTSKNYVKRYNSQGK